MAILTSTLRLSLVDQVTGRARAINGALNGIRTSQSALLGTFGRIAALGGAYLGVTQGIAGTAGAAMDFESAFADVRKVVDATDEQFENMRRTIRQMSNELPIAATDIAALFAAAGESGVATTDLKAFSEMAARVGIAFDLSAGEAGEALAKLKTQLGLTVPETGDLADAINHLSNNMASKAKDVTDYMLRVGALAEMGGFAKEEIAAIGSAMIAAGAQSETAGTAMQNVVKAMTRGKFAKKEQRDAAKALGLDLPTIAKQMQKDAPKALKTVLTAIGKAPKDQHIALLSQFFGDEAKAFAPLIGNIGLLDQALDSVGDKTKYAGSAFREYVERSNTTANVLQVLRNRFVNLGSSIGDGMLPYIKAAAIEIGEIFDTLGERVTVFDRIGTAIQGFANGLGGDGAFRQVIDDIKELLFGVVDGSAAADETGRIFMKFKEWGASVRELTSAIANNPIAKFFGELAPYGFQIMLWSVGIMALAGTIRKLAMALMFLSGASAIIGAMKTVGAIANLFNKLGPTAPRGAPYPGKAGARPSSARPGPTGPKIPSGRPGFWNGIRGGLLQGVLLSVGEEGVRAGFRHIYGDKYVEPTGTVESFRNTVKAWRDLLGSGGTPYTGEANKARQDQQTFNVFGGVQERLDPTVRIDSSSIQKMVEPSGVQSVLVTNSQAQNHVATFGNINITGVSDPQAAASAAASEFETRMRRILAEYSTN
jgi:TP901 family phage tail tape measure protein